MDSSLPTFLCLGILIKQRGHFGLFLRSTVRPTNQRAHFSQHNLRQWRHFARKSIIGHEHHPIRCLVCTENLVRIDYVTESPNVSGDELEAASGVERGSAKKRPLRWGHGLPLRGSSHLIICPYGSPLDGIRSIAFLAKGLACSSVCRLSFGSDI